MSKKKRSTPLIRWCIIILIIAILGAAWKLWSLNRIGKGTSGMKSEFEELAEKNPDVVAWLTVADTGIDSVITQADNNVYYVSTDVYGEQSFTGNPFLDYRNAPDFSDEYSIIYGHHIENHKMFGDLDLFLDEEFWDEERTGELLLVDGNRLKISFFACAKVKQDDSRYLDPRRVRNNWNREYLDQLLRDSVVSKERIELTDRILVLSTCEKAGSEDRILVFGKLVH